MVTESYRSALMKSLSVDTLLAGFAKLVGGGSLIGLNLWLATMFGPAMYGVFALSLSMILLIDGTVGAGIDLAVIGMAAGKHPAVAAQTERAGLTLKAAAVTVAIVVAATFGEMFGRHMFGSAGGRGLLILIVIGAAGLLLVRSAQTHCQLTRRFGRFAGIDLAHTTLRVLLVGAAVTAAVATPQGVLVCYALAALAVGVVSSWTLFRSEPTARIKIGQLLELGRCVRIAGATFALGAVVARLDVFALAIASTPTQLGVYGAALALATVPELVGSYLAPAFTGRTATSYRLPEFRRFFQVTQTALFIVAGAVLVSVWLMADHLILAVLPASYAPSILLLKILLVAGLAAFITFPLTMHFVMFASPRTFVLMDALTAPLIFGADLWAASRYGAIGVACVTASSRVIKATFIQLVAIRLARGAPATPSAPGLTDGAELISA